MDEGLLVTVCVSWKMAPSNSIDSPSLRGPTVVSSLVKVTVVATEPVEVQVRVEDMDPGVNTRLVMLGTAGEKYTISQILLCICNINGCVHVCDTEIFDQL